MRFLLATLYAPSGGVPTTVRVFAKALTALGHQVTIAFSPYRTAWPHLSVRPWQLLSKRPGTERTDYLGFPATVVGAYIPELEAFRYLPHREWQKLISEHDACVGVMGSVLPALVFANAGRPALCWAGTSYLADRQERMQQYALSHRLLDHLVEIPICTRIERHVLRSVDVLSISNQTESDLRVIEPAARLVGVLAPPIDIDRFKPGPVRNARPFRLGFVGRVGDPRKNIKLLVLATTELRRRGLAAEAHLFGGLPPPDVARLVADLDASAFVTFNPGGTEAELVEFYRTLDVFVIPSRQEGLAVVGLEAMACGLPIVSTRCGGPLDYVSDGETGFLTGFEASEMADRLQILLESESLRRRFGEKARAHIVANNSEDGFRNAVARHVARVFRSGLDASGENSFDAGQR